MKQQTFFPTELQALWRIAFSPFLADTDLKIIRENKNIKYPKGYDPYGNGFTCQNVSHKEEWQYFIKGLYVEPYAKYLNETLNFIADLVPTANLDPKIHTREDQLLVLKRQTVNTSHQKIRALTQVIDILKNLKAETFEQTFLDHIDHIETIYSFNPEKTDLAVTYLSYA